MSEKRHIIITKAVVEPRVISPPRPARSGLMGGANVIAV